jgi:hypothetical protein
VRLFRFLLGQNVEIPVSLGTITRSTASAFPLQIGAYPASPAITQTDVTLGAEGDVVIISYLQLDATITPLSSVTASPANGLVFEPVGTYAMPSWPGGSAEIEQWSATVTATAAGTTVSITATTSGAPTYNLMTTDELSSSLGSNVSWTPGTFVASNNTASTTSVQFPTAGSPSTSAESMYYGYAQIYNSTATGGTNPIGSEVFTYSEDGAALVAFSGSLLENTNYAPVGATAAAAPSVAVGAIWTAVAAASVSAHIIMGGRTSYGNSSNAENTFLTQIGASPQYSVCMEFLWNGESSWGTYGSSGPWVDLGGWSPDFTGFVGQKMVKIPMQVTGTPNLWTDITGGGQDANFTAFFTYCHTNGIVHICPGWEANNGYYPWAMSSGNDTTANRNGYKAAWIHIWNLANAVAPGYFKFWWNPDYNGGVSGPDFSPSGPYWPGSQYVDVVGNDIYNTWADGGSFPGDAAMLNSINTGPTPNFSEFLTYASSTGKAICIPEWGMSGSGSLPNGGDDPTYITNIFNLCVAAAEAGVTVYLFPWNNTGAAPISGYPNALATLTSLVGSAVTSGIIQTPSTNPIITQVSTLNGTINTLITPVTFSTSGGTAPYTYTSTSLPTGMSISGATLSGTPSSLFNSSVTITVHDSSATTKTATMSFTIDISAASSLNFTGIANQSGTVNTGLTVNMSTSGGTSPYTYSATGLPPGLFISGSTITGTPTTAGSYSVNVTVHDNSSTELVANQTFTFVIAAASTLVPVGPTGYTLTLAVHDEFDGTAGSSGVTAGNTGNYTKLNTRYWNQGFYYGPGAPGNPGNLGTISAEGNTHNYHGPSVLNFPGDGYLHMQGRNPGPDNGGSFNSGGWNRVFECGAINTAGLIVWNPLNNALNSAVNAAISAGTVTVFNGPSIFEIRMKYMGPNVSGSNYWWPSINFYNVSDSGATGWPGTSGQWTEEWDIWEGYSFSGGAIGNNLKSNYHQGNGSNPLNGTIACPPALANVDLSLAFHTYTVYIGSSEGIVWVDGTQVYTTSGSAYTSQWTSPQYLNFAMQTQATDGNLPPATNAAGQNDQMVDYFRAWRSN